MRLIASVFLPSSASWLVVWCLSLSTLISSRRADIANSARSWSLSAWISAIDSGVAASSRLVVNRTARLCTSGTIIRPSSIETRKPIARYMIGSTMEAYSPKRFFYSQCHGGREKRQPDAALTCICFASDTGSLWNTKPQNGFHVACGVYFR